MKGSREREREARVLICQACPQSLTTFRTPSCTIFDRILAVSRWQKPKPGDRDGGGVGRQAPRITVRIDNLILHRDLTPSKSSNSAK